MQAMMQPALNEKAAEYRELQNSVSSAAARGYVDTIISPADTRKYVIGAFEMLFTKGKNVRPRNTARSKRGGAYETDF